MRISLRSVLFSAGLVATTGAVSGAAYAGGPTVKVLLLREHGVGTATTIQPYLTQIVTTAAELNGWDPASAGQFYNKRAGAQTWIQGNDPHYGIFSLAAFLALRKQYGLDPVGQAVLTAGGGEQYFIVSMTYDKLADCKGKQLATDHEDQTFVEKIVFDSAFTLGDFKLVPTRRPGEAGDKAINNQVECALLDDAQYADAKKTAPSIKVAWQSAKLPPMVVAAFGSAPAAEKAAFQQSLGKICPKIQSTCDAIGLQSLTSTPASTYQTVIGKYP